MKLCPGYNILTPSFLIILALLLQSIPLTNARNGAEIFPMDVDYLIGTRDETSLLRKYSRSSNLCARDWIRFLDTSFPGLAINSCEDLLGCFQEPDDKRKLNMMYFRSKFWFAFALGHNYCLHCIKGTSEYENLKKAILKGYCSRYIPCSVEHFSSKKEDEGDLGTENNELQCLLFPHSADKILSSDVFLHMQSGNAAGTIATSLKRPKYFSRQRPKPQKWENELKSFQIFSKQQIELNEIDLALPYTQRFTFCKKTGRFGFGCGIFTNILIPSRYVLGDFLLIPATFLFCYALVSVCVLVPFCCEDIQFQVFTAKNRAEFKRERYYRLHNEVGSSQRDEDYSLEIHPAIQKKQSRAKQFLEFFSEFFYGSPNYDDNNWVIPSSSAHSAQFEGINWKHRTDYFGVPPGKLTAKKLKFRAFSYLWLATVFCFASEMLILGFFWISGPFFRILGFNSLGSPSQGYGAFVRYPMIMFNMMTAWSYSLLILIWVFMSNSKETSDNLFWLKPHVILPKKYGNTISLITSFWIIMILLNVGSFCFQFMFSLLGWNFSIDFYSFITSVPLAITYSIMVGMVFVFGFQILYNSLRYEPKLKVKHIRFSVAMCGINVIFIFQVLSLAVIAIHSLAIFRADGLTRVYALLSDIIAHITAVFSFVALVYIGFEWKAVTFLWDWNLSKNLGNIDPGKLPLNLDVKSTSSRFENEADDEQSIGNVAGIPQTVLNIANHGKNQNSGEQQKNKIFFDQDDFSDATRTDTSLNAGITQTANLSNSEIEKRKIHINFNGKGSNRIQVDVEPEVL